MAAGLLNFPFPEAEVALSTCRVIAGLEFNYFALSSFRESVSNCALEVFATGLIAGDYRFDGVLATGQVAGVEAVHATFG